jgi:hypothetical protein
MPGESECGIPFSDFKHFSHSISASGSEIELRRE